MRYLESEPNRASGPCLDLEVHPGTIVRLSDGAGRRTFARVLRVWRWRGEPVEVENSLLLPGHLSRVLVAGVGGADPVMLDARKPGGWGILGVMVPAEGGAP